MSTTPAQSKPRARLLVVDDHPMLREGLRRLIDEQCDMVCCGEAGTAADAQTAVEQQKPDLVILDLRLGNQDGLELIKSLKARFADLRILVLSQYESPMYVERALRAGAVGYVIKELATKEVLAAIRTVLAGEVYLTRGMAVRLLHKFVGAQAQAASAGVQPLTDRELHVLHLLGTGMSTRRIAAELNLSFKTVETHRENIKRKLGLDGATALIHYATEWAQEHISLPPGTIMDIRSKPSG